MQQERENTVVHQEKDLALPDPALQPHLFFRLLKEKIENHLQEAPHLELCLSKLENAFFAKNHTEVLVLLDDLEEFLDLIVK